MLSRPRCVLCLQIKQMMTAASDEWSRPYYQRHPTAGRGGGGGGGAPPRRVERPPMPLGPDGKPQGGTPPNGYVCYRCRQPGHFIQNCPNNSVADGGDEGGAAVRRAPRGIPTRLLVKIADSGMHIYTLREYVYIYSMQIYIYIYRERECVEREC